METLTCRLLPLAVAAGAHNMAADETLLEAAVKGLATLRFYGWSPPTLSLGYFQPERIRHQDQRLAALPFVRRPSGGDALVHDRELTYALALPAGPPWQPHQEQTRPWLRRMHEIIAAALTDFGVTTHLDSGQTAPPFAGILCFKHLTAGDLMIGADKITGSAQRRQKGALLQHGGILLGTSPHTPLLPGIHELTGQRLEPTQLAEAIANHFSRRTSFSLHPTEWSPSDRHRILDLVATRYAHPAWNRKR